MKIIEPGCTIGVLGSGQLGRMLAFSAKQMGYRIHVFSPDKDSPAGQVADVEQTAAYDDLGAVEQFAKAVDVVTFEFENIPIRTIEVAERFVPVRPGGRVLHTTQNRLREKTFLAEASLPVTEFLAIRSLDELQSATKRISKGVLKTASWGYDGKGQVKIDAGSDIEGAWSALNTDSAILEKLVDFECELSVVAARGVDGELACYAPILNHHENHILDLSVCPSGLPDKVTNEAIEIAREVLVKLDVVGVLCVELFLRRDGSLLINELAPRPHNSGHLTIDAHESSQFDQQVRAICGLPLGSTQQLKPAAMANVLGDCWEYGVPDWRRCIAHSSSLKLHLYGKREPALGRKMGHITVLADSPKLATQMAAQARKHLALSPDKIPFDECETAL